MINKVKPRAAHEMFTSPMFFTELYGRNVIVRKYKEQLDAIDQPSEKNLKLIEFIQRHSNEGFKTFLNVLDQSSPRVATNVFRTG